MNDTNVSDVRGRFAVLRANYPDGNAGATLEIIGASFLVDEPSIFGAPSPKWLDRETDWYLTQSLNVNDIAGPVPPAWRAVANPDGVILSNYGWAVFSDSNYRQYAEARAELRRDPDSRRATVLYARPSMYEYARRIGARDVFCTLGVSYLIRSGHLDAVVHMRSSDAVRGFRGDVHWQRLVQSELADDLSVLPGRLIWQASSLHVYSGDWHLIDHFAATGEHDAKVTAWTS